MLNNFTLYSLVPVAVPFSYDDCVTMIFVIRPVLVTAVSLNGCLDVQDCFRSGREVDTIIDDCGGGGKYDKN